MAKKFKLTFKKDYGFSGARLTKGQTVIVEASSASAISKDNVIPAIKSQYGIEVTRGVGLSSDMYDVTAL